MPNSEGYSECSYAVDLGIVGRVRMHVCERCGALVHDQELHDEFHTSTRGTIGDAGAPSASHATVGQASAGSGGVTPGDESS